MLHLQLFQKIGCVSCEARVSPVFPVICNVYPCSLCSLHIVTCASEPLPAVLPLPLPSPPWSLLVSALYLWVCFFSLLFMNVLCFLDSTHTWSISSAAQLFPTLYNPPWTTACQASLSITNSWTLLKLMSVESVMPSNHLIPLLLPPSIFPSVRVFSSESTLPIRWPKHWSFSFSISPSNDYSGVISFRIDFSDFL